MDPSKEMREKVEEHFQEACRRFGELSKDWDWSQFLDEEMFDSKCLGVIIVRRTLEGQWEMPGGISRIRSVVKGLTDLLVKHGVPDPYPTDWEVMRFVCKDSVGPDQGERLWGERDEGGFCFDV